MNRYVKQIPKPPKNNRLLWNLVAKWSYSVMFVLAQASLGKLNCYHTFFRYYLDVFTLCLWLFITTKPGQRPKKKKKEKKVRVGEGRGLVWEKV